MSVSWTLRGLNRVVDGTWRLGVLLYQDGVAGPACILGAGPENGGWFLGVTFRWRAEGPSWHLGWGWERGMPWRPWPYLQRGRRERTFAWAGFYLCSQEPQKPPSPPRRRGRPKKKPRHDRKKRGW